MSLSAFSNNALAQSSSIDNYQINDFRAEYKLSRDGENRSTLEATETISAEFPQYEQDHGLVRDFVKEYNEHDTDFKLQSVTDGAGRELDYHWKGDELRIGDKDKYVRGVQVYKIHYTQRDVTRFYEDTNSDEFYWDLIGVDWRVPIQTADVSLTIDQQLVGSLKSDLNCYKGQQGSEQRCSASRVLQNSWQISENNLGLGSGITVALGFESGTFAEYQKSNEEKFKDLFGLLIGIGAGLAVAAGTVSIAYYNWRSKVRKSQIGPVAPQYLPPENYSVTVSAKVFGSAKASSNSGPAQMIDLAIRRYIKLYEVREKSFWRKAQYEIEIVNSTRSLKPEEVEILNDMFGVVHPPVGSRLNMGRLRWSNRYQNSLADNSTRLDKLVQGKYGLYERDDDFKSRLRLIALILVFVGLVLWPLLFAALMVFIISFVAWAPTEKAVKLKRYLEGLKMYIGLAEKDRLEFSQSVENAQRIKDFTKEKNQGKAQIRLYERTLPYAILFGQEKSWSKELAKYYEQSNDQPGWYSGYGGRAFSAAAFADSLSSFSSSAKASGSSSSATGGSSGGGFSGGGGGGGGGGGW